ncbi:MAG: Glycosyltransferase [Rhodobacteraceae bacterium HLUCCO18]|nr:MAG: Glycosyltransferase [Rhodobacteraceae bacterium HLUCCO18]
MSGRKILHMHFGKEGGAERFFVNLVQAFDERGMEQRFVVRPGRIWRDEIARIGPITENHYRRLSLTTPILTWRTHRMIRSWQPDVIMAWMSRSSRLIPDYAPAVKLTRLGDYPRHLHHFRHNDAIVANTPGIAEKCRRLGWTGDLRVISNFARDVTLAPVTRAEMNTPEDAFVIASAGRFVRRKSFETLVEAAAKIPGAWLWLIGDGEERAALEALAERFGIAARTRFTGWVDEPMNFIASASVFAMPSRHEPLGNVILEAWQTGVPAVSTRSEGPSWFIRDGEDALLCDIGDAAGMAAVITRIRDEPGLGERLAVAGRGRLEAEFAKGPVVDAYEALFDMKKRR